MIDLTEKYQAILRLIPDEDFFREWSRRLKIRRNASPNKQGRKKILRPCPHCGKEYGAHELRTHKPVCPNKPKGMSQAHKDAIKAGVFRSYHRRA